jgi:hypothetical protein
MTAKTSVGGIVEAHSRKETTARTSINRTTLSHFKPGAISIDKYSARSYGYKKVGPNTNNKSIGIKMNTATGYDEKVIMSNFFSNER